MGKRRVKNPTAAREKSGKPQLSPVVTQKIDAKLERVGVAGLQEKELADLVEFGDSFQEELDGKEMNPIGAVRARQVFSTCWLK